MRNTILVLVLVLAGCGSSEPAPDTTKTSSGHRLTLSEAELEKAGTALSAELAKVAEADPKPTIRVDRLQNLTGHRLDINKLTDEARRRLVESNKYVVKSDPEAHTDLLLVGKVTDDLIELQVVDAANDTPALTAQAKFN